MVAVAVVLERLTNDVHNAPNHRTHLTRIVLNSLHNYEMDIPYRGTWWTLADSMLRINSRDWFDKLELKVWAHSVDIWRWLRSIFNQFRQFGIEKFSLSSKTIYRNSVHWEQSSIIGDLCIMIHEHLPPIVFCTGLWRYWVLWSSEWHCEWFTMSGELLEFHSSCGSSSMVSFYIHKYHLKTFKQFVARLW